MNSQLNSVVDLSPENGWFSLTSLSSSSSLEDAKSLRVKVNRLSLYNPGTAFLEGLLVNGWLKKLVLTCARVEAIICKWTLNQCTYSSSFFKFLHPFGLICVWFLMSGIDQCCIHQKKI